jgi:hypothetical protein
MHTMKTTVGRFALLVGLVLGVSTLAAAPAQAQYFRTGYSYYNPYQSYFQRGYSAYNMGAFPYGYYGNSVNRFSYATPWNGMNVGYQNRVVNYPAVNPYGLYSPLAPYGVSVNYYRTVTQGYYVTPYNPYLP